MGFASYFFLIFRKFSELFQYLYHPLPLQDSDKTVQCSCSHIPEMRIKAKYFSLSLDDCIPWIPTSSSWTKLLVFKVWSCLFWFIVYTLDNYKEGVGNFIVFLTHEWKYSNAGSLNKSQPHLLKYEWSKFILCLARRRYPQEEQRYSGCLREHGLTAESL
jgi:hypothetical protein